MLGVYFFLLFGVLYNIGNIFGKLVCVLFIVLLFGYECYFEEIVDIVVGGNGVDFVRIVEFCVWYDMD